jgi:hypothetical protein
LKGKRGSDKYIKLLLSALKAGSDSAPFYYRELPVKYFEIEP